MNEDSSQEMDKSYTYLELNINEEDNKDVINIEEDEINKDHKEEDINEIELVNKTITCNEERSKKIEMIEKAIKGQEFKKRNDIIVNLNECEIRQEDLLQEIKYETKMNNERYEKIIMIEKAFTNTNDSNLEASEIEKHNKVIREDKNSEENTIIEVNRESNFSMDKYKGKTSIEEDINRYKVDKANSYGYSSDIDVQESDSEDNCKIESTVNYQKLILMNMLSCIDAEEYLPVFEQHNITHETLRLLEEDDLEVMGITDRQHVVELLNYIRSLPPLRRRNYYEKLDEPLLNKDVILNLSKHIDLLTLSLKKGLEVSCCINDINCKKPQYSEISNPIIYPEGIKSSQVAFDTTKYIEKKIDEISLELEDSKEIWGIKKTTKRTGEVKKKFEDVLPYLGIVTMTFVSCILLRKAFHCL